MKLKLVSLCTAMLMLVTTIGTSAEAAKENLPQIIGEPEVSVLIDGKKVNFKGANPYMESGRVYVPFRGVGEALGAKVDYAGKTVSFKDGSKSIQLTLGSNEAKVNGKSVKMDAKASTKQGRTYVPLRFISENLGEKVEWDGVGNWVWIGKKNIRTAEEAGIKKVSFQPFMKMIGKSTSLLNERESARIYTKDQFPLKMGDATIYDVWPVSIGGYEALRIRYSGSLGSIYFLTDDSDPRNRQHVKWTNSKNNDGTLTNTYYLTTSADLIDTYIKDREWEKFKFSEINYILLRGMMTDSLELLKNPFIKE